MSRVEELYQLANVIHTGEDCEVCKMGEEMNQILEAARKAAGVEDEG